MMEEEDRTRIARKRALGMLALLLAALVFIAFSDDLFYVVGMSIIVVPASLMVYRELRRPDRLLQVSEGEVVRRTMARAEESDRVALPSDPAELLARKLSLQEDLDRLQPPSALSRFMRRHGHVVFFSFGALFAAVCVPVGILKEDIEAVQLGVSVSVVWSGFGFLLRFLETRRRRAEDRLTAELAELERLAGAAEPGPALPTSDR